MPFFCEPHCLFIIPPPPPPSYPEYAEKIINAAVERARSVQGTNPALKKVLLGAARKWRAKAERDDPAGAGAISLGSERGSVSATVVPAAATAAETAATARASGSGSGSGSESATAAAAGDTGAAAAASRWRSASSRVAGSADDGVRCRFFILSLFLFVPIFVCLLFFNFVLLNKHL
jgi:cobalamin biosynthesis Mg chelatase CobN